MGRGGINKEMQTAQFKCELCSRQITVNNPAWDMLCQHLACDECAQKAEVGVYCRIDDMYTPSQQLVQNKVLRDAIQSVSESQRCVHQRYGAHPCCIYCGQLLVTLSPIQEWTCQHCESINSGQRFQCTGCSSINHEQREKLRALQR